MNTLASLPGRAAWSIQSASDLDGARPVGSDQALAEVGTGAAVELRGVRKSFGAVRAVEDLELVVPRGATYGLIGPSGAGKTTAIRLIMSILLPDAGCVRVLGRPSALAAKDRIGYLPEERGVYRKMRVGAYLSFIGRLKGCRKSRVESKSRELLARLGLGDILRARCEDLSKGMLQRVQFVAAIVHEPELLILDEPFNGLDPVSVQALKALIADEQRRGATIVFSTHVMAQAEELCQQIVMIQKGRKVLDEPMAALRRQFDRRRIRFEPLDATADLRVLESIPGVERVQLTGEGCDIQLAAGTEPASAMRAIASRVAPARVELARIRLEDVFIRLVSGADGAGESSEALRSHLRGLGGMGVVQ
jgi:ABC-2 type transport system ATP-binding protein